MKRDASQTLMIDKGNCYVLLAYDIGTFVNLDEADRRITALKERARIRHKLRAPAHLVYRPAPLRITQETAPIKVWHYATHPSVELMLYDFGALSVMYRIPIEGDFAGLLGLSEALYDNPPLLKDSRQWVEQLVSALGEAIEKPGIAPEVEDYAVMHIEASSAPNVPLLWSEFEQELAQILRCERSVLSEQEVRDALACRISFSPEDMAAVDWNAAFLFGTEMEDVLAVLEFANVELLEMRLLDHQLDNALDQAYEVVSKQQSRWPLLRAHESSSTRIAEMQVDSAVLFERVTNTLKLLGDQYLARVYRLTSQRFHLEEWDASIIRKLQTLDSIYGKMTDRASNLRMEMLEWIIVILIAISILISFVPIGAIHS
ncbi:hypothetical protein YTPLAS18_36240 [Nitrospira sp.]|nr:hypothetical protein YTPLAS18_36240 [Nitrospira sp.]